MQNSRNSLTLSQYLEGIKLSVASTHIILFTIGSHCLNICGSWLIALCIGSRRRKFYKIPRILVISFFQVIFYVCVEAAPEQFEVGQMSYQLQEWSLRLNGKKCELVEKSDQRVVSTTSIESSFCKNLSNEYRNLVLANKQNSNEKFLLNDFPVFFIRRKGNLIRFNYKPNSECIISGKESCIIQENSLSPEQKILHKVLSKRSQLLHKSN